MGVPVVSLRGVRPAVAVALIALAAVLPGAASAGTWGPPIALPDGAESVAASIDDAGAVTVLWNDEAAEGGCSVYESIPGCAIVAARLGADGWSAPVVLSTGDAFPGGQLAVDSDARVTAIWVQTGETEIGATVWASRYADGAWSEARRISGTGLAVVTTGLAVNARGDVMAVWSDEVTRTTQSALFAGGAWSAPTTVAAGGQVADYVEALVPEPDGAFTVILRRTDADLLGASRFADGAWADEGLISSAGGTAYGASAVVAPDGALVAAWTRFAGGDIHVEAARRVGSTWGGPMTILPDGVPSQYPQLVVDGDAVLAAFELRGPLGEPLGLRFATLAGGAWSATAPFAPLATEAALLGLFADTGGAPVLVARERLGADGPWARVVWTTRVAGAWAPEAVAAEPLVTGMLFANGRGAAVLPGFGPGDEGGGEIVRFGSPPGAPTAVRATAGRDRITAAWTAPAGPRGAVTGYVATAQPGGATCRTTGATTCVIAGLDVGTAYRVTVVAANLFGSGPTSAASASATPTGVAPTVGRIAVPRSGSRGTTVRVPVTVPEPGEVTLNGTTPGSAARAARRPVWRCTARATFARAGTRVLACRLRAGALRQLRRGALHLTLTALFAPAAGGPVGRTAVATTVPRRR